MKKFILFIAVLTASIGSVWGQTENPTEPENPTESENPTVPYDVEFDNSTYKVYPEQGTNSVYAELTEFGWQTPNKKYITYAETSDGQNKSVKLFSKVYSVPENITVSGYGQYVPVRGLSGTPFKDDSHQVEDGTVIVLPSSLQYIGSDNSNNECLQMNYDGQANDVTIIIQHKTDNQLPELRGSNFTDLVTKKGENNVVNIYSLKTPDDIAGDFTDNWANCTTKVKKLGFASYPFFVKAENAYGKTHEFTFGKEKGKNPLYFSSLPFGSQQLTISVDDVLYASNDGSYHYYPSIKNVTVEPSTTEINFPSDKKTATLTLDVTDIRLNVTTNYEAELVYGHGHGVFNYSDDINNILSSNPKLFLNSEKLTFKVYKDENGSYVNDKVPYWYYAGATGHETIQTNAAIHVEKEITSDHYRYFCLPFSCKTSDIDVRLIDSDGNISDARLPRYTGNFSEETYSDSYVINEYKGQSSVFGGDAVYAQPDSTDGSCTLGANKPYAFALVMETETPNNPAKAIITFKSKADDDKTTQYTFNSWKTPVKIPVEDRERDAPNDRNSGWNMIGNPYFHYLSPSSFYGTATVSEGGDTHPVKYITLINDDHAESVTHYWVDQSLGDYQPSTGGNQQVPNEYYIKPFQAFFVQVANGCNEITTTQSGTNPYEPYTSTAEIVRHQLPAAQPDIQEHLSVKVMGQDSLSDRTTIINDENRDEHFQLMDDLAKMMNPWIQVYTWYDSVPCAFKELPLRADSSMAIPLGVNAIAAGNYTFSLDTSLTVFYGAVMLHDKQANQYYPLNEEGVQISLNEGEENDRLEIVVIPSEIPADVENVETSETLDAYVHDGRLFVENIADGSTLSIYDISGRLLYNAPASGDFNYQFNTHGVYMVVLRGNTTGSIKVVY